MASPFKLVREAAKAVEGATVKRGKKLSAASAAARRPASPSTQQWKEGYYDYEPGGTPASSDPEYTRGWKEAESE